MAGDRREQRLALRCIEELLETGITEAQLLQAAELLTASQYNDVVDERNIEHLCGYPLCNTELVDVPKQKYHISTATNQVLDITQRKKFCSSQCFKSSNYFSSQLSTLPPKARTTHKSVQLLPSKDSPRCTPVTEKATSASSTTVEKTECLVKQVTEHIVPHQTTTSTPLVTKLLPQQLVSTEDSDTTSTYDTLLTVTNQSMLPMDQPTPDTYPVSSHTSETEREFSNEFIQRISDSLTIWLGSEPVISNDTQAQDVLNPPLHDVCVSQVQKSLFLSKIQSTLTSLDEGFKAGIVEWASSFRLTNKCVTFRPPQWRVIVLLLVAMHHGEQFINHRVLEISLKELKASRQEFDLLLTKARQLEYTAQ